MYSSTVAPFSSIFFFSPVHQVVSDGYCHGGLEAGVHSW
jgi:hypothetical protein